MKIHLSTLPPYITDGAGCWLFAGLVPLHRVTVEPPCCALIVFLQGPHQPLMTPVPKLIYPPWVSQVDKVQTFNVER